MAITKIPLLQQEDVKQLQVYCCEGVEYIQYDHSHTGDLCRMTDRGSEREKGVELPVIQKWCVVRAKISRWPYVIQ